MNVAELFLKLDDIQASSRVRLDADPTCEAELRHFNRLTVAKELLRHLTGTSEYTLEVIMTGGLDLGRWEPRGEQGK